MPASDLSPGAAFPAHISAPSAAVHTNSVRSPSESSTVDLASAGGSPREGVAGPPASSPSTVVPTLDVETPVHDFAGVRASLDALRPSVDWADELQTLRPNHAILQRAYLAARQREDDLDRQLADATDSASPFVLCCQYRYDLVRHLLKPSQVALAKCKNALQQRRDSSLEIETVHLRHRNLQIQYNEAVEDSQNRITGLETQLMAATSIGIVGVASPDASHRLLAMEALLAQD
ncbi:hypothetical protein PC129_g14545 [Phytophthora cactorum]|uniref:Uncharacterized protein n=1 Tax=Phytophthora cactorum TaxID=29920 RepID=A0A329RMR8_9STRA|nr:hypothetical protein Pcac1_g7552 [Phytophthora cactorum]KAG2799456.1 hypothetical protein PC111_g20423 [Phytophthora cactorum]KAG2819360.1 hypothetical protein PC112_g12224 [Phytophthora cactorum]KAG2855132.1 hypothetical protein PC113_g12715 [Phytophthora cactorum]KAG2878413.1 hypothetical protein PC114_g23132 [Phytophthora cactorum]